MTWEESTKAFIEQWPEICEATVVFWWALGASVDEAVDDVFVGDDATLVD